MSVNIIVDAAERRWAGRALRGAQSLLGGVLVLAGLVASVPAFVLGVYAAFSAFTDEGVFGTLPEDQRDRLTQLLTLSVVVTVVGLMLGFVLLRGRRRLVLFLRRFGYVETTQVVTAAAHSIGRYWRLVTLDDDQIVPLGASASKPVGAVTKGTDAVAAVLGAVTKVARVVMWVGLVGAIAAGVLVLAQDEAAGADVQTLLDLLLESDSTEAVAFRILAVAGIGGFAVALAINLLDVLGFLALPLLIPTMAASFAYDAVREADGAKRTVVHDAAAIERTAAAVTMQRKRVIAPRLMVLRVRSAIWQQAVTRLATAADVILVDISEPTENVLWEIEALAGRHDVQHVFICYGPRLNDLFYAPDPEPAIQRMRTLLNGAEVLAYSVDRSGIRQFTRALRDALESRA